MDDDDDTDKFHSILNPFPTQKTMYEACSNYQLRFAPAIAIHKISGVQGVVEVKLPYDLRFSDIRAAGNDALHFIISQMRQMQFLSDLEYDHVMYVFPDNSLFPDNVSAYGSGSSDEPFTYVKSFLASSPLVQSHEIVSAWIQPRMMLLTDISKSMVMNIMISSSVYFSSYSMCTTFVK